MKNLLSPFFQEGERYTASSDMWSLGAVISFIANQGANLFEYEYSVKKWPGGRSSLSTTEYRLIILRKFLLITILSKKFDRFFYLHSMSCRISKVSVLGVDSLWIDCMFIPADWGS